MRDCSAVSACVRLIADRQMPPAGSAPIGSRALGPMGVWVVPLQEGEVECLGSLPGFLPISGVERGHVPAPPLDPHLAKEHAARVTLSHPNPATTLPKRQAPASLVALVPIGSDLRFRLPPASHKYLGGCAGQPLAEHRHPDRTARSRECRSGSVSAEDRLCERTVDDRGAGLEAVSPAPADGDDPMSIP